MLEKEIEKKLVDAVRNAGGMCPKYVSPGMDGMPDRLVLMPGGRLAFVETKAPGKKPRPLQLHRHAQLRALGFDVFVVDKPEQIGDVLKSVLYEDTGPFVSDTASLVTRGLLPVSQLPRERCDMVTVPCVTTCESFVSVRGLRTLNFSFSER